MKKGRLLGSVQLAQLRQRGMQGKRPVELERARRVDGQRAACARVSGLGVGDDGVETIGRTALDDEDEASLGSGLCEQHR